MLITWLSRQLSRSLHFRRHVTSTKARTRRGLRSFEQLEPRIVPAAITWSNLAGGNWQVASNWDLNRLPAVGDDVVIPDLSGNPTISSSGDVSIRNLTSAELLVISSGTMSVSQTVQLDAGLNQTGGVLLSGNTETNASDVSIANGATLGVTGVTSNGLISQWHLDGTTSDAVGTNNPVASSAITYVGAHDGRGVQIGTNGFIDIPDSASLQLQQMTLSAWNRPTGTGPNLDGSIILAKADTTGSNSSAGISWIANTSRYSVFIQGTTVTSTHTFPIGSGLHSVSGTYDGATVKLYVDGVLEGEGSRTGPISYSSTVPWVIGANPRIFRSGTFKRTFDGVIDEVTIHDRALSQAEIQASINGSYVQVAGTSSVVGVLEANTTIHAGTLDLGTSDIPNIAGLWQGEGNTTSSTGVVTVGAAPNGVTYVDGKIGRAFNFNGSNQYVAIADSTAVRPATNLTLSAWVNFSAFPGANPASIIGKAVGGGDNDSYALWYQNGVLNGYIHDNGSGFEIAAVSWAPAIGTWNHVAFTFDDAANVMRLYINGSQVATTTTNRSIVYDTQQVRIGADATNGNLSYPFNGSINEPAIYNRTLTAAEIAQLAAAPSESVTGTAVTIPTGTIAGSTTVTGTGNLNGSGIIAGNLTNDASVAGGPVIGAIAVNGGYTQSSNGTFNVAVVAGSPTTATSDKLIVYGTVSLAGALNVTLLNGYLPPLGSSLKIIDNDGTDPVNGTFADLPNGSTLYVGNVRFRINYAGGTGNDVMLNIDYPLVSISDAMATEGSSGTTAATFTIFLDHSSYLPVTVDYGSGVGGTAAASDFNSSTAGTVTIPAGSTSTTFTVPIVADSLMERDETFVVNLRNPVGAIIYDNFGLGTISDDDLQPVYTTATGTFDSTWGTGGVVRAAATVVGDTVLDPDGRIVVFSDGVRSANGGLIVTRYNPNGSLDTTFNVTGSASDSYPYGLQAAHGAVYQSGTYRGSVLAALNSIGSTADRTRPLIVRFNVDGTRDMTFGGGLGYVQFAFNGGRSETVTSMVTYDSGKFLVVGVAGATNSEGNRLIAARYNADGTLDTTFGTGGRLNFLWHYSDTNAAVKPDDSIGANRVAVDSQGRILMSGSAGQPDTYSPEFGARKNCGFVLRLTPDGLIDPTYGSSGITFVDFTQGFVAGTLNDMVLAPDGKVTVVASAINGLFNQFYVARLTASGQFDTTFDGDGVLRIAPNAPAMTVLLDTAGNVVVSGQTGATGSDSYFVTRLPADGSADNTFDTTQHDNTIILSHSGGYEFVAESLLLPNGNDLVAGSWEFGTPRETVLVAADSQRSDLAVAMTSDVSNVLLDGTITYTIKVRNTGDGAIFASLRDILPLHTSFVSLISPAGWATSPPSANASGTVVAATRGLKQSDGDQTFTLKVVLNGS